MYTLKCKYVYIYCKLTQNSSWYVLNNYKYEAAIISFLKYDIQKPNTTDFTTKEFNYKIMNDLPVWLRLY